MKGFLKNWFGLLIEDIRERRRDVCSFILAILVGSSLLAAFIFILNVIGYGIFHISVNSAFTLNSFPEGMPTFWSFEYSAISVVLLMGLIIIVGIFRFIVKLIIKSMKYFKDLSLRAKSCE